MERITDLWFRTARSLHEIAVGLGLTTVTYDMENYWQWVIGTFAGVELDITRTHTRPAADTDTRIFRIGQGTFGPTLKIALVTQLRPLIPTPIYCGQWAYRSGEEFDLVVVEVFDD